jgi:hypothetical protein
MGGVVKIKIRYRLTKFIISGWFARKTITSQIAVLAFILVRPRQYFCACAIRATLNAQQNIGSRCTPFQKQRSPLAFVSGPCLNQTGRLQVASTNSILTALPNARATRPTVESRTSSV